jgi:hypothetical protein
MDKSKLAEANDLNKKIDNLELSLGNLITCQSEEAIGISIRKLLQDCKNNEIQESIRNHVITLIKDEIKVLRARFEEL